MVQVDGSVPTCCLDAHLQNKLGNLNEQSLHEIWNGDQINRWRIAHIEGRFNESGPLCDTCNWKSAGSMPMEKALSWQERLRSREKK